MPADERHAVGWNLEALVAGEQARLVKLCARLSGDVDAAEDLAQETLIEAWRHAHKLYDPTGYVPWLNAIARNVCLRWRRRWHAEQAHTLTGGVPPAPSLEDQPADGFDLEVELERHELAEMLDRAMALLPPATRAVLVARYLEDSPQAEIAVRCGLSEGAVEARIQRGKLALRRLLGGPLRDEAAAYGLVPGGGTWQHTRVWCPFCGQHKLVCDLESNMGTATFRCPDCTRSIGGRIASTQHLELLEGVKSPRAVLSRQLAWLNHRYRHALGGADVRCPLCAHSARVVRQLPDVAPASLKDSPGMQIVCPRCGTTDANPLQYLVLDLPVTQRFWREHPRMHVLPERAIEIDGRAAVVTSFASVTTHDQIDVISAADTLAVLVVHGMPES